MVFERLACDSVDASILGEPLPFNCRVTAPNRFMKAALSEHYATYNKDEPQKSGIPTETLINMYEKWGNGGFGILLTGNVMIDTKNLEGAGNVIACRENASPELAEQLKRYASACKMDGALAIAQVGHAGRQTSALVNPTPFSASDVQLENAVFGGKYGIPVPLSTEQVKTEVVERFAFTAKYLADAGFDGVQLHAAHGYLLSQFISPRTNKRTDKYGGSAENRARIVREVYEAIRAVVPPSFVVGIKLNSVEYQDDGMHIEDAKVVCQTIEECGFDFVEMSGGTYEKFEFAHVRDSTKKREAFFLEFTDQLRSLFKRTVFYVTGGFRTVKGMVSAVEGGSTQGIGLGRPITAEPDLCKKILSGEVDSSADSKFDPSDFMFSSAAAGCQMGQAGLRPFKDVNGDVCANITDFSIQENVDRFTTEALPAHFAVVMENAKEGKPTLGSISFDSAKL